MKELKEEMLKIAGEWDGDNPGRLEDRAVIAQDIVEKIEDIETLLKELMDL